MPIGRKVGFGPSDTVLGGDPAPLPQRDTVPPNFRPMAVVVKRLDGLSMKVGLGPGDCVFDGDRATPRKKAHPPSPNFWPMSIVAKRLDESRSHLVRN